MSTLPLDVPLPTYRRQHTTAFVNNSSHRHPPDSRQTRRITHPRCELPISLHTRRCERGQNCRQRRPLWRYRGRIAAAPGHVATEIASAPEKNALQSRILAIAGDGRSSGAASTSGVMSQELGGGWRQRGSRYPLTMACTALSFTQRGGDTGGTEAPPGYRAARWTDVS